jgi:hypothetical protein
MSYAYHGDSFEDDDKQILKRLPDEVDYKKSRTDEIFQKFDEYKRKIKNVAENFILLKVQLFFYFKFEHGDVGVPTINEKTMIYIIRLRTKTKNLTDQVTIIQNQYAFHRLYKINQTCQNVLKNIKIFWYNGIYSKKKLDRTIVTIDELHDIFYNRDISKVRTNFKTQNLENDNALYFIALSKSDLFEL